MDIGNLDPEPAQEDAVEPPLPQPEVSASGRVVRKKRLTWKLLERMPEVPASLPEAAPLAARLSPAPPEHVPYIWQAVHTLQNSFGMYHEYPSVPTPMSLPLKISLTPLHLQSSPTHLFKPTPVSP